MENDVEFGPECGEEGRGLHSLSLIRGETRILKKQLSIAGNARALAKITPSEIYSEDGSLRRTIVMMIGSTLFPLLRSR